MLEPHNEYVGQVIAFTADSLAVTARELREDLFATKHLLDAVTAAAEGGAGVDKQLTYTVLSLKEFRLSTLCKATGVELDSQATRDERFAEIRALNAKVRELERLLGESGSIGQTKAHLKSMEAKLEHWWDVQGFGHVSELHFRGWGSAQLKLSCMLFGHHRSLGGMSETPVSDEEAHAAWLSELRARGFELGKEKGDREPFLVDGPVNRDLLASMISAAMPSANLLSTENHFGRRGACHLRSVSVIVRELEDLHALPAPPEAK